MVSLIVKLSGSVGIVYPGYIVLSPEVISRIYGDGLTVDHVRRRSKEPEESLDEVGRPDQFARFCDRLFVIIRNTVDCRPTRHIAGLHHVDANALVTVLESLGTDESFQRDLRSGVCASADAAPACCQT